MVLVLVLLCLVTLLKLAAISNAIRWLGGDASRFRKEIAKHRPQTVLALEVQLRVHRANFFPFGLKDYRLTGFMRRLPHGSLRGAAAWWVLVLFQKVFFQFQGLAGVSAVILVLGANAPRDMLLASRDVYGGTGAALGILLMAGIILLTGESFLSYVVLGSYGAAFHGLDIRRRRVLDEAVRPSMLLHKAGGRSLAIIEMFAYAGIFLMAFAIMTTVTYFISVQLGGYSPQALPGPGGHGLVEWRRLYDALYATVNIAGGSSEGNPTQVLTMFIGMLGTITYLLLTVIVLAALAGIAITAPSDPPASEPAMPMGWVLEIRTLGGGAHEFEIDDKEDIPALQAEIANRIGSDGIYQGTARRPGATGGAATFTIAWKNVTAATLYHREQRAAA